jgi:hypothetical protein
VAWDKRLWQAEQVQRLPQCPPVLPRAALLRQQRSARCRRGWSLRREVVGQRR